MLSKWSGFLNAESLDQNFRLRFFRFHSFYPWHSGGDYEHLVTEKDQTEVKKWVLLFK